MRLNNRVRALILSFVVLGSSAAVTGCAGDSILYDPYGHDYHRWNHAEDHRYRQWERGGNRAHLDFPDRTPGDQLAYWNWRHR